VSAFRAMLRGSRSLGVNKQELRAGPLNIARGQTNNPLRSSSSSTSPTSTSPPQATPGCR
jgi:hypothetical protein